MGPVRVTILPDRDVREVDARTAGELVKALGMHRDAHLVVRGQDILTSDTELGDEDEVEIYPVISGGRLDNKARPGRAGVTAPTRMGTVRRGVRRLRL